MNNKYDLTDFALAKQIVIDLPKVRTILTETIEKLKPYRKYRDAAAVISIAEDGIIMCDLQVGVYKTVVASKGQVNE